MKATRNTIVVRFTKNESDAISSVLFNLLQLDDGVDCNCMGTNREHRKMVEQLYNYLAPNAEG
jgi:hypothetical protein